jgi:MATE family multidrug resistance protein
MAGSSIRNDSSSSPIAEASIARDIQIESALDLNDSPANSPPRTAPEHSLSNYYTRPSFVSGTHPTILPAHPHNIHLSQEERDRLIREERSLLKDNNLLIHSASQNHSGSSLTSKVSPSEVQKTRSIPDEEEGLGQPSQTTPLLGRVKNTGEPINNADEVDQKWEDAVLAGLIKTTWQRETKVLARNAAPLILTFLLQYSLTVASIFAIGHLGSMELGAVSLASSKLILAHFVFQSLISG